MTDVMRDVGAGSSPGARSTGGDETVLLGGTAVRVRGEHPIVGLVLDELAPLRVATKADIEIRVGSELPDEPPESASRVGHVEVAGATAWLTWARTGFRARFAPTDSVVTIDVAVGRLPMPFGIPRRCYRWLEPTFFTPLEAQAYVFLLRLVEGSVFLYGRDTALLHASCVEHDGRAIALTAAGGVGKTTTATGLLARPGWRYITDDILPVTTARAVRVYPRRVMVYAYNVRQDPSLRPTLIAQGGRGGRLQWHVLERLGVARRRRRVDPAVLYGTERLGADAELAVVASLRRSPDARGTIQDAEPAVLARRCRAVMADEQETLGTLVHAWEAAGSPLVSFEDALDRHQRVYEELFRSVPRLVEVTLPHSRDVGAPSDTVARLATIVDGPP